MIKIRIAILTILSFILSDIQAQQYEFGISGVATGYMGDINTADPFYYRNLGGGVFAKYNLNPTWGIKLGYNHLYVSASDQDFKNQKQRSFHFHNQVSELAITAEFNFFKYIAGRQVNRYTPYFIGGIAAIKHDPYITSARWPKKVLLRELHLEADKEGNPITFSKFAVAIPLGIGFKYNIKGPWSIGAESIYRIAMSDNIDGISQYYLHPSKVALPKTNKNNLTINDITFLADPSQNLVQNHGRARGDGKKLDGYMTAGITLTYTIISKKCYWWQ
ncbi:type IX secretion system protein PorG [Sphingobacterium faecale]|uniref:Outer membrane beta-barrel protein n=1 Tax=Sphingobacterium faecale TaxID=2803775 RepID=A0ABS1R2H7_9SPHI|nr:DUF6089 family protein [Sphingobacterium faecale]MBL1408645.1 outer membrane beta-barrel protein [Sphingobacterium faecale]